MPQTTQLKLGVNESRVQFKCRRRKPPPFYGTTVLNFSRKVARFMLKGRRMNFWFFSFFTRIIGGERFRKATPNEYRFYSAFFMFMPVFPFLTSKLGRSILDNASPVRIWIFFTSACLIFFFGLLFWAKHVPAKISWTLGGVTWVVTIYLAFTNRL
jgi:hypothetical protein